MKIHIYQPKRQGRNGEYSIFFVFAADGGKVLADSGIKSLYPLVKAKGVGIGYNFDRQEPGGKAKQKRLEQMFWALDEYRINHPHERPKAARDYFTRAFCAPKAIAGELVKAMEEYAHSGRIGESSARIILRTSGKVAEFDASAGFGIGEDWLDRFSAFLRKSGANVNGIGLHLRNIRTVFNYARKRRLTKEYPFLDYKIKVERNTIRNMTLEQLRTLRDYPCEAWQVEYRDIFMLIVYLAGINIGDLLTCRELTNGRIVYTRAKTDKPLSIPVYPEAMEIIERYKGKRYLLNMGDRYKDYHGYMHRMNDGLKKIGKTTIVPDKVGKRRKRHVEPVFDGLSTYVARYTFASLAAECGIGRDVIAACLGHSWSDVTSHYVAYSQKQIDDAIRKMIDYINGR